MPEASPPVRSLVKKLAEVMASVSHVAKTGTNKIQNYQYATEADIVAAVRLELAKRHVMLIPNVETVSTVPTDTAKGARWWLCTLHVCFTVTDGESGETLRVSAVGQGYDPGDKAAYKAMTGATKYAILKLFLIPTGDDPEAETREPEPIAPPKPADPPPPPKPTADDIKKLIDAFAPLGVTQADLEKRLGWPLATMSGADMAGLRKFYEAKRNAPDAIPAAKAFEALVTRIRAAKTAEEVTLIHAEGVPLKLTKGDLAALDRCAKDAHGRIADAKAAPAKSEEDLLF